MPQTRLIYYAELDGRVPMVEWLAKVPHAAYAKSQAYLRRLEAEGHELLPDAEIERAIERMARFRANPPKHSFVPEGK